MGGGAAAHVSPTSSDISLKKEEGEDGEEEAGITCKSVIRATEKSLDENWSFPPPLLFVQHLLCRKKLEAAVGETLRRRVKTPECKWKDKIEHFQFGVSVKQQQLVGVAIILLTKL